MQKDPCYNPPKREGVYEFGIYSVRRTTGSCPTTCKSSSHGKAGDLKPDSPQLLLVETEALDKSFDPKS